MASNGVFQLITVPVFSDVTVTLFSLNVVLTANGQLWGYATVACSGRYALCFES